MYLTLNCCYSQSVICVRWEMFMSAKKNVVDVKLSWPPCALLTPCFGHLVSALSYAHDFNSTRYSDADPAARLPTVC